MSALKMALSQKILENFYFSIKTFQISILSRKFEYKLFTGMGGKLKSYLPLLILEQQKKWYPPFQVYHMAFKRPL